MANTAADRLAGRRTFARRALGVLGSLGVALPLALGSAAPASAHDALSSATPEADSTVTEALTTVALGFSDDLLALGGDTNSFAIQVLDEGDRHYESGCVAVNGAQATTEVASGPAGTYEVLWQVVSSDGHPTSGSYTFTYEPSEPGPQSGQATAPQCGDDWPGTAASATPGEVAATPAPEASADASAATETPAPGDDGGGPASDGAALPLWAIVLGGIAGLGLLAAIIALTLRRTRRFPGENDPTA
ncbi:copper resistance protein CopC [Microbacteriaceae bacterium 4G12]